MSRWLRLYADAMRNPKIMRLADKDFRLWVRLLCIASENDGKIAPLDDLKLVLSTRLDHLSSSLDRLISGGLIDVLSDGYTPHGWAKFQYKSDTSNERVAKHRAARNVTVTPPETDTDTEQKEDVVADAGASGRDAAPTGFDLARIADDACRAGGVRNIAPGRIAGHVALIREWRDAGADPPMILDTIRQAVANATEPINSLAYFAPIIRQAIARKEGNAQQSMGGNNGTPRPGRGSYGAAKRLIERHGTRSVAG